MSRRTPFIIHPGAGGLVGKANQFIRHSEGLDNPAIQRWLKERITTHGAGRAEPSEEIIIPDPDLFWNPQTPAGIYGYVQGSILPVSGANEWRPEGPAQDAVGGAYDCDFAPRFDGATTYLATGGNPPNGIPYFRQNLTGSIGESWNASFALLNDYLTKEGSSAPEFCYFIVGRRWDRGGATNLTHFRSHYGFRRTTSPVGGMSVYGRWGANESFWKHNVFWYGQDGIARSFANPAQLAGNNSALSSWYVMAIQFEDLRLINAVNQGYFDAALFPLDSDSKLKKRTDTTGTRWQIGLDGSFNTGSDNDIAWLEYYNRKLSPAEFDLVMARLLVKFDISPF